MTGPSTAAPLAQSTKCRFVSTSFMACFCSHSSEKDANSSQPLDNGFCPTRLTIPSSTNTNFPTPSKPLRLSAIPAQHTAFPPSGISPLLSRVAPANASSAHTARNHDTSQSASKTLQIHQDTHLIPNPISPASRWRIRSAMCLPHAISLGALAQLYYTSDIASQLSASAFGSGGRARSKANPVDPQHAAAARLFMLNSVTELCVVK